MVIVLLVIGEVTGTSARILWETDTSVPTTITIETEGKTYSKVGYCSGYPQVTVFTGLKPTSTYKVRAQQGRDMRMGSFKTIQKNVVFLSCNNVHKGSTASWDYLNNRIPDMCIHIGDQVYMDYGGTTFDKALKQENYPDMVEVFRNAYRDMWNKPHMQKILSSCSNIMVGDDHEMVDSWDQDIILPSDWRDIVADGWDKLASIYLRRRSRVIIAALQVYCEYQLSLCGQKLPGPFSLNIGGRDILFLDIRTSRASSLPLVPPVLHKEYDVIVSSVPPFFLPTLLVNELSHKICKLFKVRDLYDQWNLHQEQARELLSLTSPMIISGDVHISGRTTIEIGSWKIEQYTTSGISTIPSPQAIWLLLLLSKYHIRFIGRQLCKIKHHYWERSNGYLKLNMETMKCEHVIPSLL